VELLERLVSQQPTLASGWALLARACQKAQAYPRAIEAYRSLLGLESGNDTARLTAAVLLEKTGRKEEALALYGEVKDPALRPKAEARIRALSAPVRSA
jgi:tetratricopeptide (TPR) repeat protein